MASGHNLLFGASTVLSVSVRRWEENRVGATSLPFLREGVQNLIRFECKTTSSLKASFVDLAV